MDKQKEIEEMARIMCGNYNNGGCEIDGFVCNYKCTSHEEAEKLYEQGYRKIDKNSVVLKIKELEDTCNKCHWVNDYKILKRHEEEVIKLCEQEVKQTRKETAEKIFSQIIWYAVKRIGKTTNDSYYQISFDRLTELAKQFGVEIKE